MKEIIGSNIFENGKVRSQSTLPAQTKCSPYLPNRGRLLLQANVIGINIQEPKNEKNY